jgi:pyruvate dehydrogenase E2 component (dihydrolipoamide acetyltransferase)
MIEFKMPALGADMEAGTLVQWLKHPGDPVTRGDIIAVVDTDKGAIEIEVFDDGVLDRTLVEPGQKVPVGAVLALIRQAGQTAAAPPQAPAAAGAAPGERRPRASPAARKAAQELRIDLANVTGSGPAGAIRLDDVERAASRRRVPAPEGPTPPATPPLDRAAAMRSAIAVAMSRSKREIPHLYLSTTIDMTRMLAWLASENGKRSVERRLLPIALLLKTVARAALEVPDVNGFWRDSAFQRGAGIHLGCAIAVRGGGLVAPAVHDTDRKDLDSLMREVLDLVARARAGTLRSSELADPTLTVTNLGDLGVEVAYGVIYPPQVALVAFGKPVERPWVVDGRIEPRTVLTATVSVDHRAIDGRRAGQFLSAIDRGLQDPEGL